MSNNNNKKMTTVGGKLLTFFCLNFYLWILFSLFQHFLNVEKLAHEVTDIIKSHFIQNLSVLCCFPTFHHFCNETTAELNVRGLAFWSFPYYR